MRLSHYTCSRVNAKWEMRSINLWLPMYSLIRRKSLVSGFFLCICCTSSDSYWIIMQMYIVWQRSKYKSHNGFICRIENIYYSEYLHFSRSLIYLLLRDTIHFDSKLRGLGEIFVLQSSLNIRVPDCIMSFFLSFNSLFFDSREFFNNFDLFNYLSFVQYISSALFTRKSSSHVHFFFSVALNIWSFAQGLFNVDNNMDFLIL